MGFVVAGREVAVAPDGLIHLVDLTMAALGVTRECARGELRALIKEGGFPGVRCLKRGGDVLVTSGGAEEVLAALLKAGGVFQGPVVMTMRCFMSQNGPFVPRIREGTRAIAAREVCAEPESPEPECQWGEEPQSSAEWSARLVGDAEWAHPLFQDPPEGVRATAQPDQPEQLAPPAPLDRHRVRLTDLELDQLEATTEAQAREAQREHFGRLVEWYRALCEDAIIDPNAKELFKRALLGMLPACGRAQADQRAREGWRRGISESLD